MRKIKKNYKWVIWGILCIAYLIGIFHRMSMGVIQAELKSSFNMSTVTFAELGSVFFYVYMIMQIPAGMLVDSIGVRYTTALGTAVAGVGSLLFGFSPTIFTMYIGRFLVGIGVSVIYISISKIQSFWFYDREFGTLTGLTNIFGNLGAILAQTPLVALVSLLTRRYSFAAIGILGLFVAVLCLLIVRNKPSDIGLSSVDDIETEGTNLEKINIFKGLIKVCMNPYTWPIFILFAGFYGPFLALTGTWGQSYLKNVYGMNEIEAANYIVLPILGYAIGSLAIGWFSDWALNRKLTMLIPSTIYLLSWLILVLVFNGKPPAAFLAILLFK